MSGTSNSDLKEHVQECTKRHLEVVTDIAVLKGEVKTIKEDVAILFNKIDKLTVAIWAFTCAVAGLAGLMGYQILF